MSGGFAVDPGTIRTHARSVERVEAAVGAAVPARATLSGDAYGAIGQVFAASAVSAMATGGAAVEELRRGLVGATGSLERSAAGYENADLRVALMFGGDR